MKNHYHTILNFETTPLKARQEAKKKKKKNLGKKMNVECCTTKEPSRGKRNWYKEMCVDELRPQEKAREKNQQQCQLDKARHAK